MESFSKVSLAGHLTSNPEFTQYPSGAQRCRLNVAIYRSFKKQSGGTGEDVCFIGVTAWGEQAAVCNRSLKAGDPVQVDGHLKYEKWVDKTDGQSRSKHTVTADNVVFPSNRDNAAAKATDTNGNTQTVSETSANNTFGLNPNNPTERKAIKLMNANLKPVVEELPTAKVEYDESQDQLPF